MQSIQTKLTPKTSKSDLNLQLKSNMPFTIDDFLDYCYYVITEFEEQKYSKINENQFKNINQYTVTSAIRPCLIYEHLSETFASLYEAFKDKDKILIEAQVNEIKESIFSYWGNDNKSEQKNYQCFFALQLGWSIEAKIQTQICFKRFDTLIHDYSNVRSKGPSLGKNKYANNLENIMKLKQKQQILRKRKELSAQLLTNICMAKIKNKNPIQNSETAKNQQNYFILKYGIQLCQ